ncbi:MAG: hypothetical protein JWQ96_1346 [Segetibacter sp.]|nr:hypothetical protein [Segetibacter sp.]
MKPFVRLSVFLLFAMALFTSCKKAVPKQAKFIPKEASFVASINSKALQDKLVENQATLENIFKAMASDNDSSLSKGKKEWEELTKSGVDLREDVYMAVVQKGGNLVQGTGSSLTAVVAGLGDQAKFEAYLKKKNPAMEVRKEKGFSYATWEGDKIVGWGNDVIIALTYQKGFNNQMEFDSATGAYSFKPPVNADADLKTEIASYFNLKEDLSVASIPEFRDLAGESGDARFWVNSASSLEDMPIPLPRLKELLSNNFTAATLKFDDGKIVVHSKSYTSKALGDLLKEYSGPSANLDLIEHYPSNNINGFAVFAFNPELINGIAKQLEMSAMADNWLTKMMGAPYKLQDVVKALKGDFALVVSDYQPTGANGTTASALNPAKMLLNIPIGDKTQMNRLMDKLVESQMIVKVNNQYTLSPMLSSIGYKLSVDDKNILFASDSITLSQYKAGTAKAGINSDLRSDFKGKPGVMYVNLESIIGAIPVSAEANNVAIHTKAKETFKDLKGYTDNFTGKYYEGHFELRLKNEKENSLTTLLNFANTVSQAMEKRKMERKNSDSQFNDTTVTDTVLPVPPAE